MFDFKCCRFVLLWRNILQKYYVYQFWAMIPDTTNLSAGLKGKGKYTFPNRVTILEASKPQFHSVYNILFNSQPSASHLVAYTSENQFSYFPTCFTLYAHKVCSNGTSYGQLAVHLYTETTCTLVIYQLHHEQILNKAVHYFQNNLHYCLWYGG